MSAPVSVLIPAHDEAAWIGPCLSALLAGGPPPAGRAAEVIVIANGCTDATAAAARGHAGRAAAAGWHLRVIELGEGGKLGALNAGDAAAAPGGIRIYLDADVTVGAGLIGQLVQALATDAPRHAGGRPRIAPARSALTRAYARFWSRLPFVRDGVAGFGVFAMNAAGRARWGNWPDIISDDTFARLHFAPAERTAVAAEYSWPMVEGFRNLVRVRRRQNAGVAEIARRYPGLLANDDPKRRSPLALAAMSLRDPVGFCAYAAVALAVKTPLFRDRSRWARGR